MTVQQYNLFMEEGMEGDAADEKSKTARKDSCFLEGAGATIVPGRGVIRGTGNQLVKVPSAGTDKFFGIVKRDYNRRTDIDGNPVAIAEGDGLTIVKEYRHRIVAAVNVTAGAPAFLQVTANGAILPSMFNTSVDAGNAVATGAIFDKTALAGEMTIIDLTPISQG